VSKPSRVIDEVSGHNELSDVVTIIMGIQRLPTLLPQSAQVSSQPEHRKQHYSHYPTAYYALFQV